MDQIFQERFGFNKNMKVFSTQIEQCIGHSEPVEECTEARPNVSTGST
jgi:hypothetical protein